MANCRICGRQAGILKKEHAECRAKQEKSKKDISSLVQFSYNHVDEIRYLRHRAEELANESMLQFDDAMQAVANGITKVIDVALEDNALTIEEESRIVEIRKTFEVVLDPAVLRSSQEKLVKSAILRDLKSGIVRSRLQIENNLPFVFQRNEQVIWVFEEVKFFETKTKTQYVGSSHGLSIRIAKGLYYRPGISKGERVQIQHTAHADTGLFLISNKNIHFKGRHKAFRIPLAKIVGLEMLQDGITLFKDGANPLPQMFIIDDPWFAANAISSMS